MTRRPRGTYEAGERTREAILDRAARMASVEGLEGLSIGRLAADLDMSKSGLFAHFGSKEDLQIAAIDHAREVFIREVVAPAFRAPRGRKRLEALCRRWLRYARERVFPGGCFFAAAAVEFDSRPGPVRDRIAFVLQEWLGALETAVRKAQESGEIDPSVAPRQIAFELHAVVTAANTAAQLFDDRGAWRRASRGVARILQSVSPSKDPV